MPATAPEAAATPRPRTDGQALAAPHIGVFDSGIGGLSVLRALQQQLPGARISYIADAAHIPWGAKSAAWVEARSLQLGGWLIDQGADLVLVACNTATTQAMAGLRARWPGRHFVGVEPGIKPAVAASPSGRVAVLATEGTLRSPRVAELVARHAGDAQLLHLPCPGLVEAIEASSPDDGPASALARQLDAIAHILRQAGVDTVVLGCTHYPLVADALQARLGPAVQLVDTGQAVARQAARLLQAAAPVAGGSAGRLDLFSTGDPALLQRAARRWLHPAASAQALPLLPAAVG